MNNTLIKLDKIHCSLDRNHQISDLSWLINSGDHWAVVGSNGAGKTALAGVLGGDIPLSSGRILRHSELEGKQAIAYVSFELQVALHEHDRRFDDSNVREDAFDPRTLARDAILQGADPGKEFDAWVSRFRLKHILERGIRFISSGEMRKVLLLRAVTSQPAILVLDNPLEGLDRQSQQDIEQLINQLALEFNIILLSRRREDIVPCINQLLLIDDLKITAAGPREAIEQSDAFKHLFPPLPPAPEQLPRPDPMLEYFKVDNQQALVSMHNISVSYHDDPVMRGISFSLIPGQHTSLSGPNGCGKSTLLSLMTGDSHKAYGQDITLFGIKRGSGESVWDIKRKFGQVSNQLHESYISGWTTKEVVISGFFDSIGLYENYGGCEDRAAQEWLAAMDMQPLTNTLFRKLSFGQQRMALLARAMVKYPPVLILDEPCTGLDEYNRQLFLRTLDMIAAHTDTTIVFVSHLPGEIPGCIQQELEFIPAADGLYQLVDTTRARVDHR
jgi:molybdate transport system ATP-binding protein